MVRYPAAPRAEHAHGVVRLGVRREHEGAGPGWMALTCAQRLDDAGPGHGDVEDAARRPCTRRSSAEQLRRALAASADHGDAVPLLQDAPDSLAHHRVVVGQHDADHRGTAERGTERGSWSRRRARRAPGSRRRAPRRARASPPGPASAASWIMPGGMPRPSSAISSTTRSGEDSSRTRTFRAPACRATLVSASCTMRYRARRAAGGTSAASASKLDLEAGLPERTAPAAIRWRPRGRGPPAPAGGAGRRCGARCRSCRPPARASRRPCGARAPGCAAGAEAASPGRGAARSARDPARRGSRARRRVSSSSRTSSSRRASSRSCSCEARSASSAWRRSVVSSVAPSIRRGAPSSPKSTRPLVHTQRISPVAGWTTRNSTP